LKKTETQRNEKREYAIAFRIGKSWSFFTGGNDNLTIRLHTEEEAKRDLAHLVPTHGCLNLALVKLVDYSVNVPLGALTIKIED
jgi:hypothetical protein